MSQSNENEIAKLEHDNLFHVKKVGLFVDNGDGTLVRQGEIVNESTINNLIHDNTHTGNKELRVYQENHICTDNTTSTPLGAGETFTGAWQEHLNYQEVNVSIDTDLRAM